MKNIYLDHSATTPVDPTVLKAMLPYLKNNFGNAASLHGFGQTATKAVDLARNQVATFLGCEHGEIIFTSGATESDNLAIKGMIAGIKAKPGAPDKLHVITLAIEHEAVLEPCKELAHWGCEVTFLPVQTNGVVKLDTVKKAIKDNTVLISIMYANNEVGAIQPIREIGQMLEKINQDRKNKIYSHTDATQAVNFLNCNIKHLHVDLLSLSGHKIYGPKGVGALFVKKGTPLRATQTGGRQERNLRSGTLNVPGIVGLGQAIELVGKSQIQNNKKITALRDYLIKNILKKIPRVICNTDGANSLPSHAHFSFLDIEGEAILMGLDMEGIAVSTGSACASGSLEASHVLLAMGLKQEIAHNAIRFTLGKNTTKEEINQVLKVLPPIVKKFRDMAKNLDY